MTKFHFIKFLFLVLIAFPASGQKIKYKDVYGLLSTKQYEAAEPFLKKYLEANDDNPNAYLFMGLICQEKFEKDDILKETEVAVQHMDSAVMYFDKAKTGLNEKEIRKNKEYYTAYNRRDLRSGEFGVSLSDVQLDLENRMNSLRERIDRVRMVKHYFSQSVDLYNRSNQLFLKVQKSYPGLKELYLRSDDQLLADLKTLSERYDSCSKAFGNYKTSLSTMSKTQYNQKWSPKPVSDFKLDGKDVVNFYSDNIDTWDYKAFADKTREYIVKEVKPIQENLISHDIAINKLSEKLETDSVSIQDGLSKIENELKDNTLRKFDPNPLPLDIFALKICELRYKSILVQNRKKRDSLDVRYQVERAGIRANAAKKLDSVANKLANSNVDEAALNYADFVKNTYSKVDILKSYIRTVTEYAGREVRASDLDLKLKTESLRWLILENDSIPLFTENNRTPFKPLLIDEGKYTAGLSFKTSVAEGYFYTIPESHLPKVKVTFPVDKQNFTIAMLSSMKPLVTTDPNGQIFYIAMVRETPLGTKFPATVTKIYKSDGLSWSINVQMDFVPTELFLRADTGELVIKSQNDNNIVVDKNGTILKNN